MSESHAFDSIGDMVGICLMFILGNAVPTIHTICTNYIIFLLKKDFCEAHTNGNEFHITVVHGQLWTKPLS